MEGLGFALVSPELRHAVYAHIGIAGRAKQIRKWWIIGR